jgi:hypothetical protein
MPTSVYFDKGTFGEQNLYEDLIIEQLKVFGHDVYYMPRTLIKEDKLFGEDVLSQFNDAYMIEMYMEEVEGYGGDKELISKFGLEIRDEVNFVVSRRVWENTVSGDANLIVATRPNEGDLIYFPRIKKIFQIDFVDHDDPFYQVDNLPVYKLSCSTFEYSSEAIDTGVTVIDAIETEASLDALFYQITLEQPSTLNEFMGLEDALGFVDLETSTDSGYLVSETDTYNGNLLMETGDYIVSEEYVIDTIDAEAKNEFIETQADLILDFTEKNPFGEPSSLGGI